jgi:hypothetical protein
MRLVKVNDIILNMDRIAVIKGRNRSQDYGGGVAVYAYVDSSNYVELGVCETDEDYEKFMSALYHGMQETFVTEVVPRDDYTEEPDLEELWGK